MERGARQARQALQELLDGLRAKSADFFGCAAGLVEALDGGGGGHGHERGEAAPIGGIVGRPVLHRLGQVRPEAPEEQGDVAAQGAPVGVDLVEDHEAAAVVLEQVVPVGRPDQEVFEHHVVGEEDVGRTLAERSPVGVFRAAVVPSHPHVRVPRLGEIGRDPLLLVGGQGVHRVDQDRRQAAALEADAILDGVLQHR